MSLLYTQKVTSAFVPRQHFYLYVLFEFSCISYRYGPHFEDVQLVGKPTNMTVQAGSSIHLNCRISLLQDKTVSNQNGIKLKA